MANNNFFRTSLPKIHHIVQNTMIVHPKEVILAALKDHFADDDLYHYVKDEWGFNKTVDNTDLPLDAGLYDDVCTRLFIGENYRFDVIFYPAILVKHGGSRSVPISINREEGSVLYQFREFEDGYGNIIFLKVPKSFILAGAWEGSIVIDIRTRSLRSRDELVQETALFFTDITFKNLQKSGVIVKGVNIGAPSEIEDRNDKLFLQSITLDIRSEWRREIPVGNLLEVINFSVDFANLSSSNPIIAPNLSISTRYTLVDLILSL